MKALAAVLLFAFCVAASIYCYRQHLGDGSTLLGVAAALSLLGVVDAFGDDS